MDSISLTHIRCYGYTGYLPEERTLGQWFEVDLQLWLDLAIASQTDDINDTLDYRQTVEAIKKLVRAEKFFLIERLAEAIAQIALQSTRIERVRVRLTKVAAPIPEFGGKVTVEIVREQRSNRPSSIPSNL